MKESFKIWAKVQLMKQCLTHSEIGTCVTVPKFVFKSLEFPHSSLKPLNFQKNISMVTVHLTANDHPTGQTCRPVWSTSRRRSSDDCPHCHPMPYARDQRA